MEHFACNGRWKIYIPFHSMPCRWCKTQASSHNSQGIVDDRADKMGISTAELDRGALICG